jgi:hypothetical protein
VRPDEHLLGMLCQPGRDQLGHRRAPRRRSQATTIATRRYRSAVPVR